MRRERNHREHFCRKDSLSPPLKVLVPGWDAGNGASILDTSLRAGSTPKMTQGRDPSVAARGVSSLALTSVPLGFPFQEMRGSLKRSEMGFWQPALVAYCLWSNYLKAQA